MRIPTTMLLAATFVAPIAAATPVALDESVLLIEGRTAYLDLDVTDADQPKVADLIDHGFRIVTKPRHGTLETRSPYPFPRWSSAWRYTPAAGFSGSDSFTFQVTDPTGLRSNIATCSITVAANVAPLASDQRTAVYRDEASRSRRFCVYDPDSQRVACRVVVHPRHGTVNAGGMLFSYTPKPGFVGTDSFTYVADDGFAASSPATVRVTVRGQKNQRAGDFIAIIVEERLRPAIAPELTRLLDDLTREGYRAEIMPGPSTGTTLALWTQLKQLYERADRNLTGAILIGNLPKAVMVNSDGRHHSDLPYWNMHRLATADDGTGIKDFHIWVSRISVGKSRYGSEATLIKRYFDANHAYRTGRSRLPHAAYVYNANHAVIGRDHEPLRRLWPTVVYRGEASDRDAKQEFLGRPDIDEAGADALVAGGELFDEASHGSANSFMNGKFRSDDVYRLIAQQRVLIAQSCISGAFGGVVNHHLFTRGGGLIWALGGTDLVGDITLTGAAGKDRVLSLLGAGETWGRSLLDDFCFHGGRDRLVFYGDLSLPVKKSPANVMPVVTAFTASALTTSVGTPVTFAATFIDPDAGSADSPFVAFEHRLEWFLEGYDCGRRAPVVVTDLNGAKTGRATHVFTHPGTYTARVEVIDEWQARAWKEILITVTAARPPTANG